MEKPYNILLIGANGMLGHALKDVLAQHIVVALDSTQLDITNQPSVDKAIQRYAPHIIINAAAYTAVDDCETQPDRAKLVNGTALNYLAKAAQKNNAILVHYSTDYVFDGLQVNGYEETYDKIAPVNMYGKSKALGEQYIQELMENYYIIRTAWLYGKPGKNFVDTMQVLGKEKTELKIVNDQHGSPTFTQDLAQQTLYILENNVPFGIYHVTNSGHCTWFEFAQEIFNYTNNPITMLPCETKDFPRPAKRPQYSILLNTKLPNLRSWQDALHEYLEQS